MEDLKTKRSTIDFTVKGYHLDLNGQIGSPRFMELLEEGRWHHYSGIFETGVFLELDLTLVLVNINVNFRRPAFLGETLEIITEVKRVGNKSITLEQIIKEKKSQEIILDGELTYVLKDNKKGHGIPITSSIRQLLLLGE